MCPVVHFEMPADDKKRMSSFYSKAFGWKTEQMGSDMSDYVVVTTTPSGKNGRPSEPGAINGGFFQRTSDQRMQHPSLVVAVENMADAMKAVIAAGGTVDGEPQMIPGIGAYVRVVDTEGNGISMLEPSPSM